MTPNEKSVRLFRVHGYGNCHICGKPKIEQGEMWCSYPHGRLPTATVNPNKRSFWVWDKPNASNPSALDSTTAQP